MTRWAIGFSCARLSCLATSLLFLGCGSTPPVGRANDVAAGRELYLRNCASCHGWEGAGDGSIASNSRIHPRNLKRPWEYRQGSDSESVYRSIRQGVRGTVMTPWEGRMNELEMRQVAAYVCSLHPQEQKKGGSPGKTPAPLDH